MNSKDAIKCHRREQAIKEGNRGKVQVDDQAENMQIDEPGKVGSWGRDVNLGPVNEAGVPVAVVDVNTRLILKYKQVTSTCVVLSVHTLYRYVPRTRTRRHVRMTAPFWSKKTRKKQERSKL
jgi:hypothetical protein